MKEKEKVLDEELKDEEKIEGYEFESEDTEVHHHDHKQSSIAENKEEVPSKPKRPALDRKAAALPVKVFYPLDKMFEYQWPPDIHGEFYYLEHHISDFVDDASLPLKYKGIFKQNETISVLGRIDSFWVRVRII